MVGLGSSLRKASVNQGLLRYAVGIAPKYNSTLEVLSVDLPLFNQDVEDKAPVNVTEFKKKLKGADGILVGA